MNEKNLINYYNKFNEDKRLTTKHGMVEYITTLKYIDKYIKKGSNILEVGAGTGRYSVELENKGYCVTALELVKHNLKVIEKKNTKVKCVLGNAINLSMFNDNTFDSVLLLGPMYHLIDMKDKLKALLEAKRVVKENGYIFISYCMNEYAVITHGFVNNNINNCVKNNELDKSFKCLSKNTDLYSFVRIKDINYLKNKTKLKRIKILSQDGPSEYLKKVINNMDDETFNNYLNYHFSTCEEKTLLSAGRHILDILKKS